MSGDELYEICGQGGERELCDLLRHALNSELRPARLAQREKTIPGLVSRADVVVWEGNDRTRPAAMIEAKMIYASDVVDIRDRWQRYLSADATKLQPAVSAGVPAYLVTWVPAFLRVTREIRYMKGHVDGKLRFDLEHTRTAALDLLGEFGTPLHAASTHATSDDGELVLDAYLTHLAPLRQE
ncbi:hypothetical protein [Ornithinimicrobium sp. W1665]|uniref:hypothetical protein n=1 Tax=Ornithinimicrobium sp. W1665 TaxID=3416666 RepID=UPI003CF0D357